MQGDLSGRVLGRYRVGERVAQSQVWEVYRAFQDEVKREVAIQVLAPQLAEVPEVVTAFERAVRAAVALQHLHIERVYTVYQQDGIVGKVGEWIEGVSLEALLSELAAQRLLLPLQVVGTIVSQVASGLTYANELEQNPLHRDVMPANIMLRRGGRSPEDMDMLQFVSNLGPKDVVLTNYGVSRVAHDAVQQLFPDRVPGLADYLSPEVCRGERGVDTRADVYSLGAVLYEMLTGTVPFGGGVPSKVMQMQMNEPLRLPRSLRPDLPEEVEQVVLKALEKDRNRRFSDAEAFGLAVKQRMGHVKAPLQFAPMPEVIPGRGKAPVERGPAAAVPPPRPTPSAGQAPPPSVAAREQARGEAQKQEPPSPGTRKSEGGGVIVLVLVLVLLLAVVGAGAWWMFMR